MKSAMTTTNHSAATTTALVARVALIAPLAFLIAACEPSADASTAFATPGVATAASAPSLGAASGFSALGASTVTCTNSSDLSGDVGVSPGTAITGFNPSCTLAGAIHAGDGVAAQAHSDLSTAYDGLKAVPCEYDLTGADLGGQTLEPGVYCFDTSAGLT